MNKQNIKVESFRVGNHLYIKAADLLKVFEAFNSGKTHADLQNYKQYLTELQNK